MPSTIAKRLAKLPEAQRIALARQLTPRWVNGYSPHTPHPKQQAFLMLNQREALYGGAAGGGKSDSLLMAALQYVDVPGYSALILRRTWPDLISTGAILDRASQWFANTDVRKHDGGRQWSFPSGARLSFGYMQHLKDRDKFASAEYQFIGFDELTHFEEKQYSFLFSRLRKPQIPCLSCSTPVKFTKGGWAHVNKVKCGVVFPDPSALAELKPAPDGTRIWDVPLRMRGATNPGSIGHEWVFNRFINKDTKRAGTIFLPASLRDNPSLNQDEYEESLSHLTAIDKARLLDGDWSAFESGGVFQRHWWKIVDDAPNKILPRCRFWDMAGTEGEGDYTVGTLVSLDESNGEWYIEHQVRGQWSPAKSENIIKQVAQHDGINVKIRMEQEPGSAGKTVIDHYRRKVLVGYDFDGDRPTGSKPLRAQPMARAAEKGLVKLVAGKWNRQFIDETEVFPLGNHDDQVDSASGAFNTIAHPMTGKRKVRLITD